VFRWAGTRRFVAPRGMKAKPLRERAWQVAPDRP
jgi:hypothetical protein